MHISVNLERNWRAIRELFIEAQNVLQKRCREKLHTHVFFAQHNFPKFVPELGHNAYKFRACIFRIVSFKTDSQVSESFQQLIRGKGPSL
jgi:hypothetical protein